MEERVKLPGPIRDHNGIYRWHIYGTEYAINKDVKTETDDYQGPYSPTILKNILCLFLQNL